MAGWIVARRSRWFLGAAFFLAFSAFLAYPQNAVSQSVSSQPATNEESSEKPEPVQAGNPIPDLTASTSGGVSANVQALPKDPRSYDLWVLVPAGLAILMTVFTRQVIPSLFVAVVAGACMMFPCLLPDSPYSGGNAFLATARLVVEKYVVGSIHELPETHVSHIRIIVFTMVIAFMVGVIGRNGGTAGMVNLVAGKTASRQRGALTAWFAGLVVFFDDYANCMIVGPTMRSVFDRLKLSREKLAYIIDSTAAPVASIALIGTWVGAEVGFIQTGLDELQKTGVPAFMHNADGSAIGAMQAFINSLPYRFYPILTMLMVFLIAALDKDFGPMRRAESRALSRLDKDTPSLSSATSASGSVTSVEPISQREEGTWWLGFFPVAVLVIATLTVLAGTGLSKSGSWAELAPEKPAWERLGMLISNADSYQSIMYGAVLAAVTAVLLTIPSRACSAKEAVEAGLEAMSRTTPAIVILILAWALSAVQKDLMLGQVLTAHLQAIEFPARWLPFSVFVAAAVISFSTGTSWGTMGILCPMVASLAAKLAAPLPPDIALTVLYAAIGAVLSGAVFGDHCSPISDTTVLSSIGADCNHEQHVWTQMPYAIVAAIFAMGLGDLLTSVYDLHWYYGLVIAASGLTLFVLMVARRAVPSFELSAANR